MYQLTNYDSLNLADLRGFVERAQEENLHLDFKTLRDAHLSSGDDRKNLACALSGFANSCGGLIVWGVDARKNADGVDCAMQLKPISQVSALVGRLNALTGEGVDPTVDGVRHRAIETELGAGFAITLVPESDAGPHMAKLGEN
ncbi:MAG: helix-turn-helix domain-containing protein, partial [Burkholderiales bacterium]